MLKYALRYEAMGFCVIPLLPGQKEPAIKWGEYQNRRSTPKEIMEWWKKWPNANIGVVTGQISGLETLDFDRYKENYDEAIESIALMEKNAPRAKTPRGGLHVYFKASGLKSAVDIFPGVDLRGEGSYIVVPPSVNGNGKKYEWILPIDGRARHFLPSIPKGIKEAIGKGLGNYNSRTRDYNNSRARDYNNNYNSRNRDYNNNSSNNNSSISINNNINYNNNYLLKHAKNDFLNPSKSYYDCIVNEINNLRNTPKDPMTTNDYKMTTNDYKMTTNDYKRLHGATNDYTDYKRLQDEDSPQQEMTTNDYNDYKRLQEGGEMTTNDYTNDYKMTTDDYKRLQMTTNDYKIFVQGRRDADLFHLANSLIKGKCDPRMVVEVLRIAAKNCEPPFPENELNIKILSAMERAVKRDGLLADDVRDFVSSTTGEFTNQDIYRALNIVSREQKKNITVILLRMVKEKIIEKSGNRNGTFRKVENESPIIDIVSADTTPYQIILPMGVHQLVRIHPGNIIIIAGETNSGKTALCMNIAKDNKKTHKINYLSSEMSDGVELKIRLQEFGEPLEFWKDVDFRFRADKFEDVIKPDDLNIIDYLDEGQEEAYKMTKRIKQIAHKLQKGIAVICIQKSSMKQYGFGGEGTKNASRLYMTVTGKNKLTIEKGKIWANKMINPNGASIEFKLTSGCNFVWDKNDWKNYKGEPLLRYER